VLLDPLPLDTTSARSPWLVVKQPQVRATRNSRRYPRAGMVQADFGGTASIPRGRHSARYVPVDGRIVTPKSAGANAVPRSLTRQLH
jgi:hypothetical protein